MIHNTQCLASLLSSSTIVFPAKVHFFRNPLIKMDHSASNVESTKRRHALLKDQVRSVKRKDSERYEIVPIQNPLSLEKGFFAVVRACQLLVQKNDGLTLVGLAGPSGSGKTVFTEKILNFMPSIALISMDNYNDSSRVIDKNFDDPRLTDYDTLLKNIYDLKEGKPVQVPIYDFKSSSRTGYRTLEVPSSRIVIIEGIYALSEKLRPLLDLRVSITGGIHFDLVKRVLRDIQRAGHEPEHIIHQITETVYPMYKAFIEPDLKTAHIKIVNKFNPFSGFQSPTYILKSSRNLTVDQVKSIMPEHTETMEQIYDIYLLPPGEDPESCQSYLRMRNRDGKYELMFEEWVTDPPFIISPRISFEVSVRLLGGLMALGYTIAAILQRNIHVFCCDERACVKIDWLERLNRHYIQVQGRDRLVVEGIAEKLGLEGSYIPRTYIEQIQLEKLVNEVAALPDELKSKLSIDEDLASSSQEALAQAFARRVTFRKNIKRGISHSYSSERETNFHDSTEGAAPTLANQGAIEQLSEQISTLNDRMEEFTCRVGELNSKLTHKGVSGSSQNIARQADAHNGSAPTTYFPSQLAKESPLTEEISSITRGQRQVMHQLESLASLLRENLGERSHEAEPEKKKLTGDVDIIKALILTLPIGCLGILLLKTFVQRS